MKTGQSAADCFQKITEGRWGGATVEFPAGHPELEARGLFYDAMDFQVAAKPKKNDPRTLSWKLPPGQPFHVALYRLDLAGRVYGKAKDLTATVQDRAVHLAELEAGSWRLMAFVENRLYEGTHAELTGGPFINILDPAAVKRFLDVTYDAYYQQCGEHFGKTLAAFFNDEVSLMSGFLKDQTHMG